MKLDVFIDINNLYFSLKDVHNAKLNYEALLDKIKELGELGNVRAFGSSRSYNHNFNVMLKKCGVTATFDRDYHKGTAIGLEMLESNADLIVLCCNTESLIPVIRKVEQRVIVFACNISEDMQEACFTHFEIMEDLWHV